MRLRTLLTALTTTAVLTLTGCATTPEKTPSGGPRPTLTPDDLAHHTQQTFNITWAMASETERDTYCTSLAILGPDTAADQMRTGAGGSTDLDWPYMAELLQNECDQR